MPIEHWVEICEAAGVNVSRLSPQDLYLLEGKIYADEELRQLVVPAYIVDGVLPISARLTVLRAMPESERAALRKRIGAI